MNTIILCMVLFFVAVNAFSLGPRSVIRSFKNELSMGTFTQDVTFNTIAREWRFKWSPENDKKSLSSAQVTLDLFKSALKNVEGSKVQRIVCGACNDFKVIVAVPEDKYAAWEGKGHPPESEFLAAIKAISGITQIETQTYTIEPVL